ncbi:MAG: 16S rRNA (guanine(527)-N(7))-methyltransferase RsmG [Octadecabacter sp.]|nr:16S rRNA (guanine(527)-N(7))-methyltransferase RsmG [Octadecabacter sp.]
MNEEKHALDVSRETLEKLEQFAALVLKWTNKINLIGSQSEADIWNRHIVDSVQVYDLAPNDWKTWADLGSGGGFPGIVIAILDPKRRPVTLVESDQRKALFLQTARRQLDLNVTVLNKRIEDVVESSFDIVTARALAPLDTLLGYAQPLLSTGGTALFPKGRRFEDELAAAQINWDFEVDQLPSITSEDSRILRIARIAKREF